MRRTHLLLLSISPLILFGVGCVSGPAPAPTARPPAVANLSPTAQAIEKYGLVDSPVISIQPKSFLPAVIEAKKGQEVMWINEDPGGPHWPASDPHPTHTNYPGFDAGAPIVPGNSWTFTFDKVGDWTYHDHLRPEVKGTIRVSE